MSRPQPNNPLHGVTLEQMVRELVEQFGWDGLARDVPVACFRTAPSISSSVKYLRKATRARTQLEQAYIAYRARRER
jgi:uncharacterized protein (DUF2132 family)